MTTQRLFPDPILCVMGPPGSGKTFQAGTLIPEFREAVKNKKPNQPLIHVNDVAWLQADRAGVDTLRNHGVCPRVMDISIGPQSQVDMFGDNPIAQLADARKRYFRHVSAHIDALAAAANKGEIRLVVIDSMTALTRMVTDSFLVEELAGGKFDRYSAYRLANAVIGQFVNKLKAIPVPQVWLAHCRTAFSQDATELKDDQARRPVKHVVEWDVQRGVAGAVEPIPSVTFGAKVEGGGTDPVKFSLVTSHDGVFPIKNRWEAHTRNMTNPDLQSVWDVIVAASAKAE